MSLDSKLMVVSLTPGENSIEASPPRELFLLPVDAGHPWFEVSRDGQRFLLRVTPEQGAQPLRAIVNWPALLKN
jgi:hypothetical protein